MVLLVVHLMRQRKADRGGLGGKKEQPYMTANSTGFVIELSPCSVSGEDAHKCAGQRR